MKSKSTSSFIAGVMRHMTFLKVFQLGKMNHVTVKKFNEGSVANETQ